MKKISRLLPVLILLLVFAYLFLPSPDGSSAAMPQTQEKTESVSQITQPPAAETAAEVQAEEQLQEIPAENAEDSLLPEDGSYTTKEDVKEYLVQYGHLPPNFVTKKEAEKAGWSGGNLEKILPGMCIGGDRFGNREGLLPKAKGRIWTECDINTLGKSSRGAERLVFSNDGLFYYTDDHYESFTKLD